MKAGTCLNLISSSKETAKQLHVALSSVLCCICMLKNFLQLRIKWFGGAANN